MPKVIDSAGKSYSCVQLHSKADYRVWSYTMTEHLKTAGMYEVVIKTDTVKSGDKIDTKVGQEMEQQAISFLISTIGQSILETVLHCTTAAEIWGHLEKSLGSKGGDEQLELMSELNSFNCQSASEVAAMVTRVLAIQGRLNALNVTVPEVLIVSAITRALPDEFRGFLHGWKLFDQDYKTLNRFVGKLLDETRELVKETQTLNVAVDANWRRTNYRGRGSRGPNILMANQLRNDQHWRHTEAYHHVDPYNRNQSMAHNLQLQNRPMMGNRQHDQYHQTLPTTVNRQYENHYQGPFTAMGAFGPNNVCNYCRKPGHWKSECNKLRGRSATNPANHEIIFMAVADETIDTTVWIADSGCSAHMSPNRAWMQNYKECIEPRRIRLGNSDILLAQGVGQIKTKQGILGKVYYVPGLTHNLFSIAEATKNNVEVRITSTGIVFLKDRQTVLEGVRENGTFLLSLQVCSSSEQAYAATLEDWHKRLGHLPKEVIQKMIESGAVEGMKIVAHEADTCIDCKLNKCKRASHETRRANQICRPGQALHLDVIGPIRQEGLSGERFILNSKDQITGFRMTACLRTKSQVPESTKLMISQAETQTGNQTLIITTDNGSEFTSERLEIFCQHRGIQHIYSAPYVPQQNGVVERDNQHLINQARTLLNGAKLPIELWPEAIRIATYLHNRSLSKTRDVTPHEAWTGRKPNLKNLRIFGQNASVLIPEHNRTKFDMKGRLMIFVGYTENFQTYRFFDPESKKIVISCDASFLKEIGIVGENEQSKMNEATMVNVPNQDRGVDLDDVIANESINQNATETGPQISNQNDEPQTSEPIETSGNSVASPSGNRTFLINDDHPRRSEGPSLIAVDDEEHEKAREPQENLRASNNVSGQASTVPRPIFMSFDQYPRARTLRPKGRLNYKDMATGKPDLSLQVALTEAPPGTWKQIEGRNDASQWYRACDEEIQSMLDNKVFQLVHADGNHVVGSRWVFNLKTAHDGQTKAKARLVAQGFTQVEGVDYFETYAPVVHMDAIRLLFALKAAYNLCMEQVDISTAFLNGELKEKVYMRQPPGYNDGTDRVWLLRKSIYGLKQAPRAWNECFSKFLKDIGFEAVEGEACIFKREEPLSFIALYVDDAIILARTQLTCEQVIDDIMKEFKIHRVTSKRFLGIQYQENDGELIIHQRDYIMNILEKHGMGEANSAPTPILSGHNNANDQNLTIEDKDKFREIVGALLYAACNTRPDISYTVGYLGRKVTHPTTADWTTMKRCLRYLKGTLDLGISFRSSPRGGLSAFCDADYAGDQESLKSTTGQLILFGDSPIAWKSKLQRSVVTSTTEAEFLAVSATIKTIKYLKNILKNMGVKDEKATPIYCDNQGAVAIVSDKASAQRTRHLGAQLAFARQENNEGSVKVQHVAGIDNRADILTKPLTGEKFSMNRSLIMTTLFMISIMNLGLLATASRASDNGMTQMRSSVIWVPTNILPEIGRDYLNVTLSLEDRCKSIKTRATEISDKQTFRYFATNRMVEHCVETRNRLVGDLLRELLQGRNIKNKRSATEIRLDDLPEYEDKSAWSILYDGFPFINSLVQYFDKNSEHNTMPKLVKTVKQMGIALNSTRETTKLLAESMEASVRYNKINTDALYEVIRSVNKTASDLGPIVEELLEAMMIVSRMDKEILEDRELLYNLKRSLQNGQVDVQLLAKRFDWCAWLQKYKNEDTTFTDLRVDNTSLNIQFNTPIHDLKTTIYEARVLKEWINETTFFEFINYPRFAMFNASANCARYLEVEERQVPYETCTEENQVLDMSRLEGLDKEMVHVSKEQFKRLTYPTIIKSKELIYIQCFNNKYTIETEKGSITENCPKEVFSTLQSSTIKVANITHRAIKISQQLKEALEARNQASLSKFISPWQLKTDQVMQDLARMRSETLNQEEAIKKLNDITDYKIIIDTVKKNPERSTIILIVMCGAVIIIIRRLRKDSLTELIEASVLANLNKSQGTNVDKGDQRWQTPNINITVTQSATPKKGWKRTGSEVSEEIRKGSEETQKGLMYSSSQTYVFTQSMPRLSIEN